MPSPDERQPIKISLEDLASVTLPERDVISSPTPSSGTRSYGTITEAAEQFVPVTEERGSILLQAWFYLGVAGLLGALTGWAIAEPGFVDGASQRWGNFWIVPLILMLMCLAFGIAESTVERSLYKAALRGALSLPLGVILGFVFFYMGNIIYAVGLNICYEAGARSVRNPAVWVMRGIAWMAFVTRF